MYACTLYIQPGEGEEEDGEQEERQHTRNEILAALYEIEHDSHWKDYISHHVNESMSNFARFSILSLSSGYIGNVYACSRAIHAITNLHTQLNRSSHQPIRIYTALTVCIVV